MDVLGNWMLLYRAWILIYNLETLIFARLENVNFLKSLYVAKTLPLLTNHGK